MKPVYLGKTFLKLGAKMPPHTEVELRAAPLTRVQQTAARQTTSTAEPAIVIGKRTYWGLLSLVTIKSLPARDSS